MVMVMVMVMIMMVVMPVRLLLGFLALALTRGECVAVNTVNIHFFT